DFMLVGYPVEEVSPCNPRPDNGNPQTIAIPRNLLYISIASLAVSTIDLTLGRCRCKLNTPIIPSVLNVQSRQGLRRHPFQAHRHGEVGRAPRPGDSEACDAEGARGCDSRDELNLFHRRNRGKAPLS